MQWVPGGKYYNVKKYYNVTDLQLQKVLQCLHIFDNIRNLTFETVMAKFLFLFYFCNDDSVKYDPLYVA